MAETGWTQKIPGPAVRASGDGGKNHPLVHLICYAGGAWGCSMCLEGFFRIPENPTFVIKKHVAMSTLTLYSKFEMLPEDLQQQVLDYVEFLLSRQANGAKPKPPARPKPKFKPGFGGAKGMFVMSPDFDEPLEDFKDYM